MTDHEVIQAADSVEEAIQYMLMCEEKCHNGAGFSFQTIRPTFTEPTSILSAMCKREYPISARINLNHRSSPYGEYTTSDINADLSTWLKYRDDFSSNYAACTILRASNGSGNLSIALSTNLNAKKIIPDAKMRQGFEPCSMYALGTDEAELSLFQQSLIYDDYVMNALIFQYEWRRRKGRNIELRLGVDPVQTCAELSRIARGVYKQL